MSLDDMQLKRRICNYYHQRGLEVSHIEVDKIAKKRMKADNMTYREALESIEQDSVGRYRKED